jgi:lycopene cyclase domain-containing protein
MIIPDYAYLSVLLVSLAGLFWLDYRLKLAAFITPLKTLRILGIVVGIFLIWDIAGITLGIFQTNPDFVIGIHFVTPNLPLEEILLLTLISYLGLLINTLLDRRCKK